MEWIWWKSYFRFHLWIWIICFRELRKKNTKPVSMDIKTRGARGKEQSPTDLAQMFAHNDPFWLEVRVVSKSIGVGVSDKRFSEGRLHCHLSGQFFPGEKSCCSNIRNRMAEQVRDYRRHRRNQFRAFHQWCWPFSQCQLWTSFALLRRKRATILCSLVPSFKNH